MQCLQNLFWDETNHEVFAMFVGEHMRDLCLGMGVALGEVQRQHALSHIA